MKRKYGIIVGKLRMISCPDSPKIPGHNVKSIPDRFGQLQCEVEKTEPAGEK